MSTTEPRLLGGRYELGEPLGFGGMAEVLSGRDTRLGRDVAVKILRADLARDPAFLTRFRREAQSAAGLNYPAIVAVYDTGEQDGIPYIVMEYVSGRTLRDVLAEDGRLLPRRALEITAEVAGALEFSHQAGIVHRDIKPANVMLTRAGEIKVMDFGIARAASASSQTMTQTAQILGTAQYLSPEQAQGEQVDARSDVYSTGCLLYELLTGVPPFQGDTAVSVAYQHVREDPTPPSQLDPELPASIDAVVLKAMAKNPANRYQSAAEFRADLERAADGRRVEAGPVLTAAGATTVLPAAAATTVLLRPDGDERRGRRGVAYVLLLAAVIAVFVIAALIAKNLFSHSSAALHVPNEVGKTQQQATADLEANKLKVANVINNPIGTDNNNSKNGIVYRTSPPDSVPVNQGAGVVLYVSSGPARVAVPAGLVGKSQADATAALKAAELQVGNVNTQDGAGQPGTVLETNPAAGVGLDAGSKVDLTVVSGMNGVPSVLNQSYDQAAQQLQAAGFTPQRNDVQDNSAVGTVIAQDPPGGTRAKNGTTVTLSVSTGPPPPPPPTTTPPPPPMTTSAPATSSTPASSSPPGTSSSASSPSASVSVSTSPPVPPKA